MYWAYSAPDSQKPRVSPELRLHRSRVLVINLRLRYGMNYQGENNGVTVNWKLEKHEINTYTEVVFCQLYVLCKKYLYYLG